MRDAWDIQAESIEATNRRIDKLANPRLTRGKVVSVNPLRITLDDDQTTVLPDTPANDAGPLAVGDRVRCIHQGSQVVIIGRTGGQGDTGEIVVGGARYASSGIFETFTPSAWGLTNGAAGNQFFGMLTWTRPRPFTPPTGWGFDAFLTSSSGYGFISTINTGHTSTDVSGRYAQFGNASLVALSIGWRLTRIT